MPSTIAPRSMPPLLVVALLAGVGACAGSGTQPGKGDPYRPGEAPPPDSIGFFLTRYDKALARWSEMKLAPRSPRQESTLRALEGSLHDEAVKRRDELLSEIISGPPRNREVAVVALGFSGDPVVLGPLLQALSDPAPAVVQKTHLALGILALPETPLGEIAHDLRLHADPWTRNNAAFALHRIVSAGGRMDGLGDVLIAALADSEPGVRAQAASTLGILAEPTAIPGIAALFADPAPLVTRAAAATLGAIARAHPESLGSVARALAGGLESTAPNVRAGLVEELTLLRGESLGDDPAAWRDWASRVP
jgi:hypothetical protein